MAKIDSEAYKLIGERIHKARIERRWSQAELAEKANLSFSHISDIEKGKKQPRVMTLLQIAEALQVSTDSLLRPDIPSVSEIYEDEFRGILSDCTSAERDGILKIVREVKAAFRTIKPNNNE